MEEDSARTYTFHVSASSLFASYFGKKQYIYIKTTFLVFHSPLVFRWQPYYNYGGVLEKHITVRGHDTFYHSSTNGIFLDYGAPPC